MWRWRKRTDEDFSEEIQTNITLDMDRLEAEGMSPEDAKTAALRAFGNITRAKERFHESRWPIWLQQVAQDLHYAGRILRKDPLFSLVAIASLAVAIWLNTSVFTIVNALLFRPLPVERADRLADVYTSGIAGDAFQPSSYPDYLDFRSRNEVFTDILGFTPTFAAIRGRDQSRLALGEAVTGNYFGLLGVKAALGRMLLPEDDRLDAPRATVISERFWRREFDAKPGAVGQTLRIGGQTYTIVGIVPARFTGFFPMLQPEVWTPIVRLGDVEQAGIQQTVPSPGKTALERRGQRWMFLKGRLRDGQSFDQAAANLALVMKGLAEEYPATNAKRRVSIARTADVRLLPEYDVYARVASAAVMLVMSLVLVVAGTNVASMLLARHSARRREFGIRLAIGASRSRLVRQLLTESLLLSLCGAIVGLGLAWVGSDQSTAVSLPIPVPLTFDLGFDGRVIAFTTIVAIVASAVAGLGPAIRATRPNVIAEINGETRLQVGGRQWSLRDVLIALQMAVTLLLLVAAGLLVRGSTTLRSTDVGFRIDGLVALSPSPTLIGYDEARSREFYWRVMKRVQELPGVQSAALTWRVPLGLNFGGSTVFLPGHQTSSDTGTSIQSTTVSRGYFETLGVRILEGREFAESDTPMTPRVVIVNSAMARKYWPNESAIGQRFRVPTWDGAEYEVVGVSADYKIRTVGEAPTPYIHFADSQRPLTAQMILARSAGDAATLAAAIRREIRALDSNMVFLEGQTMREHADVMLAPAERAAFVIGRAGLVAMLLAAVGLYGGIAYTVARRTHEIGVRLALGAERRAIVGLVMRDGFRIVGVGAMVGLLPALGAAHALSGVLYGISPWDPLAWGSAGAVLLVASLLANVLPARRATKVDPLIALRCE